MESNAKIFSGTGSQYLAEKIAKKFVAKVIQRVGQLENLPFSGQEEFYLQKLGKQFRYLVYKEYKIDISYIKSVKYLQ